MEIKEKYLPYMPTTMCVEYTVGSHKTFSQRMAILMSAEDNLKQAFEEYKERVYKKQHPIRYFFKKIFNKLKGRA